SLFRIGGQPFAETYKVATLATGDFAGAKLVTTFTPNIRWHLTYAQVEERLTGAHTGGSVVINGIPTNALQPSGNLSPTVNQFFNGDDYAFITSLEVTPIRGLDLRPTFAYFHAEGNTSGSSRAAVGQLSPQIPVSILAPGSTTPTTVLVDTQTTPQ